MTDHRTRRLASPDRPRLRTRRRMLRFIRSTGFEPTPWQWRMLARQLERR